MRDRHSLPPGLPDNIDAKKSIARGWYEELRDVICASYEKIEDDVVGPLSDRDPGRFELTPWQREEGKGSFGVNTTARSPKPNRMERNRDPKQIGSHAMDELRHDRVIGEVFPDRVDGPCTGGQYFAVHVRPRIVGHPRVEAGHQTACEDLYQHQHENRSALPGK